MSNAKAIFVEHEKHTMIWNDKVKKLETDSKITLERAEELLREGSIAMPDGDDEMDSLLEAAEASQRDASKTMKENAGRVTGRSPARERTSTQPGQHGSTPAAKRQKSPFGLAGRHSEADQADETRKQK